LSGTFSRTIQSAKLGVVGTTATNTGNVFFDSFYSTVGTLIGPQVGTVLM
jgi:hypothetical protein